MKDIKLEKRLKVIADAFYRICEKIDKVQINTQSAKKLEDTFKRIGEKLSF